MLESGTWNIASIACLAVRTRDVLGLWYLRSLLVQVNAFCLSHHVASHQGDSLVLWSLTELVAVLVPGHNNQTCLYPMMSLQTCTIQC